MAVPAPPAAVIETLVGVTEYEHCEPAAWLTVTVWPAIASVPERAAPLFADTVIVTVPLPLPLPPDAIEIHEALLAAVHVHVPALVTATDVPEEPPAAMEMVTGATMGEHAPVAAS